MALRHLYSAFILAAAFALTACTSQGGSAVRTGPAVPANAGPVRVYASGNPPENAADLGVIEVHGEQQDGTIDELLPLFVRKVAELGGDVAVVDGVRARFELVPRVQVETGYVMCGRGHPCASKTAYGSTDEVMVVSIFGRAMSTHGAPPPAAPPPAAPPPAAPPPAVPSNGDVEIK